MVYAMRKKRGGVRLREWLKEERRTQKWVGEQIGTHQTNVSAWILGRPIPLEMALAIEVLTGIEAKAWAEAVDESGEYASAPVTRTA
jgi:plasmid maintenance system antidote protein VapI